jgi:uncharacterized protein YkwD
VLAIVTNWLWREGVYAKKTIENRIFSILLFVIAGLIVFAATIIITSVIESRTGADHIFAIGDSLVPLSSSASTQEELNAAYPIDKGMRDGEPVEFVPVNYADPPWEAVFPALEEQYAAAVALGYTESGQTIRDYIFNGINERRIQEGLEPILLIPSGNLYKFTYIRAAEIMVLYSHDRPDGTNSLTVMTDNYVWGEILNGQPEIWKTLQTWFDSPTHLGTILCPEITEMSFVGFEPENGESIGREAVLFGKSDCGY